MPAAERDAAAQRIKAEAEALLTRRCPRPLTAPPAVEYDVFISYRVNTDAALAQRLYHLLHGEFFAALRCPPGAMPASAGSQRVPVRVFLDSACLEDGEPWRQVCTSGQSCWLCLLGKCQSYGHGAVMGQSWRRGGRASWTR